MTIWQTIILAAIAVFALKLAGYLVPPALVEKPTPVQIEELRHSGWLKPGQPAWYNAGIYIFKPSLFEFTAKLEKSPRGEYELTDAVNALLAAHHKIAGLEIQGRWVDVRDPEVLASLEKQSS